MRGGELSKDEQGAILSLYAPESHCLSSWAYYAYRTTFSPDPFSFLYQFFGSIESKSIPKKLIERHGAFQLAMFTNTSYLAKIFTVTTEDSASDYLVYANWSSLASGMKRIWANVKIRRFVFTPSKIASGIYSQDIHLHSFLQTYVKITKERKHFHKTHHSDTLGSGWTSQLQLTHIYKV